MISYECVAEGPAVVLLAGLPFDRSSWDAVVPLLRGVRIVRCDLRGLGASRSLPGPYSLEAHADDVAELLDALNIPAAVIAGHSFGGYVGLTLLRRHPARLKGLAVIGAAVAADSPECAAIHDARAALFASWGTTMHLDDAFMARLFASGYPAAHPAQFAHATTVANLPSATAVAEMVRAMRTRPDATPYVRGASVPVAGVAGGHDAVIPLNDMSDALGDRLRLVPQAGHMLPLEAPIEVAQCIAELVTRTASVTSDGGKV